MKTKHRRPENEICIRHSLRILYNTSCVYTSLHPFRFIYTIRSRRIIKPIHRPTHLHHRTQYLDFPIKSL